VTSSARSLSLNVRVVRTLIGDDRRVLTTMGLCRVDAVKVCCIKSKFSYYLFKIIQETNARLVEYIRWLQSCGVGRLNGGDVGRNFADEIKQMTKRDVSRQQHDDADSSM
jgi:hypothetical protein